MDLMKVISGAGFDGKAILAVVEKEVIKPLLVNKVMPAIDALKADVESGKVDLIPGTSLDNMAIVAVIGMLEAQLLKQIEAM